MLRFRCELLTIFVQYCKKTKQRNPEATSPPQLSSEDQSAMHNAATRDLTFELTQNAACCGRIITAGFEICRKAVDKASVHTMKTHKKQQKASRTNDIV